MGVVARGLILVLEMWSKESRERCLLALLGDSLRQNPEKADLGDEDESDCIAESLNKKKGFCIEW